MRRTFIGAVAAVMLLVTALPAAAARPDGAGGGGKPAGVTCQQFGIGVLQSQGLLAAVAKDGLEWPIGSGETLPLSTVLSIHRDDPATANVVLKAYAELLGIASAEVVAAVDAACPAG